MIVRRAARALDDRLGASSFTREALNKVFPDHWTFMLGEIALYVFLVLVLTGIFLSFFYVPSTEELVYRGAYEPLRGAEFSQAYHSVVRLSWDVRAGIVMRQIHHWAALLFLAAILVHVLRIFFTGAFRRPREINWIVGVTLLLLGLGSGFTGYSLPDDLLSGTGLRIAYSIALSVPVIGPWITFLVFGGEFPSPDMLGRLFVLHIFLLPAALAALISVHLAVIWRQKHTQFPGPGRTETNVVGSRLWPTYAAKSIGLFLGVAAVLGAMGGLLQINPVWLYGPFEASAVTSPAQPDWYLGWVEGALRLFPPWEIRAFGVTVPNPFFPGVLLPGLTFLALYLWPFLERRFTGDREEHHLLDQPRDHPLRTGIGAGVLVFYAMLFIAGSNDIVAMVLRVPVDTVTALMQGGTLVLPLLVGWIVHRAMRSLRASGARRLLEVPGAAWLWPARYEGRRPS